MQNHNATDKINKKFLSEKVRVVQKAFIFHPKDENKFLILIRNENDSSRPGDFDLVGGSVKHKEMLIDSLLREIDEETNLEVKTPKVYIVTSRFDEKRNIYNIYLGYTAKATSTDVSINPTEHASYKWMTLEEFEKVAKDHFFLDIIKLAMGKD